MEHEDLAEAPHKSGAMEVAGVESGLGQFQPLPPFASFSYMFSYSIVHKENGQLSFSLELRSLSTPYSIFYVELYTI
jgi:hypothetical protein